MLFLTVISLLQNTTKVASFMTSLACKAENTQWSQELCIIQVAFWLSVKYCPIPPLHAARSVHFFGSYPSPGTMFARQNATIWSTITPPPLQYSPLARDGLLGGEAVTK